MWICACCRKPVRRGERTLVVSREYRMMKLMLHSRRTYRFDMVCKDCLNGLLKDERGGSYEGPIHLPRMRV